MFKPGIPALFCALFAAGCASVGTGGRTLFVSSGGQIGAAATEQNPLPSLADAVAQAKPGDIIRLAPGTYHESKTIRLQANGTETQPIRVECPSPDRAVLDFSAQAEDKKNSHGIDVAGDYWQLVGIEVAHAGSYGFFITGSHNLLDHCVSRENRNSGTEISTGGGYNLIQYCQSYRNFDPKTSGEDADGFTAKHEVGPGNVFRGCLSYQNADDGWDLWMAPNPVLIEDCVSVRNGYNLWHIYPYEGDGNGFKFGGNYVATAHICRRCVSIENPLNGFDQNHNIGPITVEDCVAIRCGKGFSFPELPRTGQVVLRNNTSFGCQNVLEPQVVSENNHWYPDIPVGVLGPLPRPGHRDRPHAGEVPTTSPAPIVVPQDAPEWGFPSDTPPVRDPELPTTQPSTAPPPAD
ncbi:MAG: right-handed parallel beta-helix repeat-containing protein [Tepidisphaeraceae bacterium]|jgi:hypothetical protein